MSAICKASEGVDKQSNGPAQVDAVERGGADTPPAPAKAAQMVERWACYFYAGAAKPWGKVAIPAWCRENVI